MSAHERVVLDGVLTAAECAELMYLARCFGVIGYRTAVASATCFELQTAEPALMLPLMAAREKVRAAVEEALGKDLLVEFTGLISWRPGASIAFHHDANRPYLQQRNYSAVTYLNTADEDFGGGAFLFQEGSPAQVLPAPGRVVAYNAQDVHGVAAVERFGERFTLTLWFSTLVEHNEDTKLLARLSETYKEPAGLPPSMYQLPDGCDLRLCRLAMMGLGLAQNGVPILAAPDSGSRDGSSGGSGGGSSTMETGQLQPFQVLVNLPRLAAWLGIRQADNYDCNGNAAAATAAGSSSVEGQQGSSRSEQQQQDTKPNGVVLTSVEFESVEQAVLALQYWAWSRHGQRWPKEDVCCRHLCEDGGQQCQPPAAGADCSWVAVAAQGKQTFLPESQCSSSQQLEQLCLELRQAAVEAAAYLGRLRQDYDSIVPQWLAMGAIY